MLVLFTRSPGVSTLPFVIAQAFVRVSLHTGSHR